MPLVCLRPLRGRLADDMCIVELRRPVHPIVATTEPSRDTRRPCRPIGPNTTRAMSGKSSRGNIRPSHDLWPLCASTCNREAGCPSGVDKGGQPGRGVDNTFTVAKFESLDLQAGPRCTTRGNEEPLQAWVWPSTTRGPRPTPRCPCFPRAAPS